MERQLGILVSGLLERGHRVTVVAGRCELPPHLGLRWLRIRGPRRPFSLWYPWFLVAASIAVWRRRVGVLHTTGALVLNRADVSTVHFCHRAFHAGGGGLQAKRVTAGYRLNAWLTSVMSRLAERYCYRNSHTRRLVAVSEGVGRELREFFPAVAEAVTVIPNGVNRDAFTPNGPGRDALRAGWGVGDGELIALFVGGDWERKGLRSAVEAVGRARGWHLVVVGPGDVERYARLAAEAGAGGRVHFAGRIAETGPHYRAADAFLLPTKYETFSLVTFEAAASGMPLLVSRVSGVEDILVERQNGWFIEGDAEAIAQRLEELAEDESLRRAMGENARAASARFDWDRVVGAYAELYADLAAAGST
jgi:glycosyltransferase involved in cell wall biosynthesis